MKLSARQQKVWNELVALSQEGYNKNREEIHIGGYCKNSWDKNGFWDINRKPLKDIKMLESWAKKGLIKLRTEFNRQTGVFNPKADSWGYSATREDYFVTIVGDK